MWFFKKWWLKWQYRDMPFKMANWTESQKSSCIEDTLDDIHRVTQKFENHQVRLQLKKDKEKVLNTARDIFGREYKLKHPIFTQEEIARISRGAVIQSLLILMLIVFEGIIYSQLLRTIIPREIRDEYSWISLVAGLMCSLIIVLGLNKAIQFYNEYIEAKMIKETDKLEPALMKPFIVKRNKAYLMFVAFVLFSVFAGIMREKVLLGSNADPETGKIIFFMSLALSFLAAFVLALTERDLHEKQTKYKVFKNWKRQHKEKKQYVTSLKEMKSKSEYFLSKNMEIYWSLVLDLQRIFYRQYDEKEETLYTEYRAALQSGKFNPGSITYNLYAKYQPIQSVSEELFKYGVREDPRIKMVLEKINNQYAQIAALEKDTETFSTDPATLKTPATHEPV